MHVVITGANRGIGLALYDRYVQLGHEVTGTARGGGEFERLDVTDAASIDAFTGRLDGRAVDLLICNAGIYPDKGHSLADGFPPEVWVTTMATNVTGVFLTIQALMPNLQAAKSGRIAIVSSRMGSQDLAWGGSYAYRASKAAVTNIGRNLAVDLKPLGIAVGIYHPGWVQTDMGGPSGEVTVETSGDGLVQRFDALSLQTTGCFEAFDGTALPL